MFARRVVVVSVEKSLRKRLGVGLMAAGAAVDSYEAADEIPAGRIDAHLAVVHIADPQRLGDVAAVGARLPDEARVVCVVPQSDLEVMVAAMQSSERVAALLVAEDLDVSVLAATASRLLQGDIFGIEKIVPWGTRIYTTLVGDYQDKSMCIADLSEFARSIGVRRKYRESIEQCADEMLMNALYDAPVDSEGKQLFAEVPIKERLSIRLEQKAVVQYACNGGTFYLAVRDHYGTLTRETVLHYLDKCLHADEQIDRKTGGAGLGLYLMASTASSFIFNVLPGVATECMCTFDLKAPKVLVQNAAFFTERVDASGRLVGTPGTVLPAGVGHPVDRRRSEAPGGRWLTWGLSSAILLLVALIGLVAYPRFVTDTGALRVSTSPPGAIIEVDGRTRGNTEEGALLVRGLEANSAHRVTARRDGWSTVEQVVQATPGETTSVSLTMMPTGATVFASSEPPGAAVFAGGRDLGATPLTISSLPPGEEIELTFKKAGYETASRKVVVPASGGDAFVSTSLSLDPQFASVRIETRPPGAKIYQNGTLLAGLTTPVDEVIVPADSRVVFTLVLDGHRPVRVPLKLRPGQRGEPVTAALEPGGSITVRTNIGSRITVVGIEGCTRKRSPLTCPVANGTYRVRVRSRDPALDHELELEVDGNNVERELSFGVVAARPGHRIALASGRKVKRVALEAGGAVLEVVGEDGAETTEVEVAVPSRGVVQVP